MAELATQAFQEGCMFRRVHVARSLAEFWGTLAW
jgi:hypothetical protein